MPAVSRSGNLNSLPDLVEHPDWVLACSAIEEICEGRMVADELRKMPSIMPIARWMLLSSFLSTLCALPDPAA